MPHTLPVVSSWFESEKIDDRISRTVEPHVHEFLRSNIWHIRGSARDLIVDSGLGIASLRTEQPELFLNNPVLVVTHAHLDHMGSAHEFDDVRVHADEPIATPVGNSVCGDKLSQQLGISEELPQFLIDARPVGFEPELYRLRPVTNAGRLRGGECLHLGDSEFRILHLPGHTPGSIALFEPATGVLFSGDVIYDGLLLDELPESNISDYLASLERLRSLPVTTVHPGHGPSFGRARLHALIDDYVATRSSGH